VIEIVDSDDAVSAIDIGMESRDELGWEEYNPTEFGPNILPDSNNAGPSMAGSSCSSGRAPVTVTESQAATASDSDIVISNLLSSSLSAQRSFSNLNIDPLDNPYSVDADFGCDF
jgi:hypothetical protein